MQLTETARQTSKEVRHADASVRLQLGRNLRKLRNVMFKVIFIRAGRSIRGSLNSIIFLQPDVRKPATPESIMQHACRKLVPRSQLCSCVQCRKAASKQTVISKPPNNSNECVKAGMHSGILTHAGICVPACLHACTNARRA